MKKLLISLVILLILFFTSSTPTFAFIGTFTASDVSFDMTTRKLSFSMSDWMLGGMSINYICATKSSDFAHVDTSQSICNDTTGHNMGNSLVETDLDLFQFNQYAIAEDDTYYIHINDFLGNNAHSQALSYEGTPFVPTPTPTPDPDHITVNSYQSIGVEATPKITFDKAVPEVAPATCSLIANSDSAVVDSGIVFNHEQYEMTLGIPVGDTPTGWTNTATYHLVCTRADSSTFSSNSFRYFPSPTVIDTVQNENLIDVYFTPDYYPFVDSSLRAPMGWFDALGYGTCETNVLHESQYVGVCHYDLLINPQLPSNNNVYVSTGAYEDGVSYGVESENPISVLGLAPEVNMLATDSAISGVAYTQSGSFTDNFSSSWSAKVRYQDGGEYEDLSLDGNSFEVSHIYDAPGNYFIQVLVYDDDEMVGAGGTWVTVEPGNTAPEVDAQGPYTVTEGQTVEVSATGTDPEAETLIYAWDLDNNGSYETSGQNATFDATSLTPGNYTVKVRATDPGELTAVDEATVTVTSNIQTMTIDPGADSYVDQDHPNQNYGTETMLFSDNSPKKISYMRFNLEPLAGKTIVSASLRLKVNDPSSVVQSLRLADTTTWTETGIHYNNRPLFNSTITTFTPSVNEGIYNLDVASAVYTRKGIKMTLGVATSTGTDRVKFYSRNAATAGNRPQLTVEYTD